ncbi:hypothetical protein RN001_011082 [Aquatica leii]|uniref:Uncharacterized protein n=1 Tax=Aquatica leii TaxID=1421715 RepID=A0AAN7PAM1_9COLE|nr:hypothetical protein RN001_011082 [Aquatica leii]
MKLNAKLVLILVINYKIAFGELKVTINGNSLHSCVSAIVEQAFEEEPVTFVISGSDSMIVPTQYGTYVVNINTLEEVSFLSNTNYVIFVTNAKNLENVINLLRVGYYVEDATKYKLLIVTSSRNVKLMITKMWIHKIINVAILHYQKKNNDQSLILYTSNPFDQSNRCGETPNLINAQTCGLKLVTLYMRYKSFNNCSVGFVIPEDNSDSLVNVIPRYILTQLGTSFNTTVIYHSDRFDTSPLINLIVIIYLTDLPNVQADKVTIYTDDLVWVTPVSKKSFMGLESVFDDFTWIMIMLTFLSTSFAWWILTSNYSWNQMFLSFFQIWCISLCGCLNASPSLRHLKFVFLLYLFGVIVLHAAFKCNLIKALTITAYSDRIRIIPAIASSKLPLIADSDMIEMFFSDDIPENILYSNIQNKLISRSRGLEDVVFYKNCNHLNFRHVVEKFQATTKLKVIYFVDNSITGQYKVSLALFEKHFFTDSLNKFTQTLIESGVYSKAISDFGNEYYLNLGNKESDKEASNVVVLTVGHLYGMFILWGVGIMASTLVFIFEIVLQKCN